MYFCYFFIISLAHYVYTIFVQQVVTQLFILKSKNHIRVVYNLNTQYAILQDPPP